MFVFPYVPGGPSTSPEQHQAELNRVGAVTSGNDFMNSIVRPIAYGGVGAATMGMAPAITNMLTSPDSQPTPVGGGMQYPSQPGGSGTGTGGVGQPGGMDLSWLTNLLGGAAGAYGLTQNPGSPGLNPQQQSLIDAGNQTYQAGLDPRQALYNRTAQQVQDQARAGSSAHGVAMGPYGAGVENQAMNNFNIDWQNQQLGRQATGLQAMTGANQAANQAGQLGLQNRQFGAGQNASNLNAFLTALKGGSGGPGAGLGGAVGGIGSWLNSLFPGAAGGAVNNIGGASGLYGSGVDQFGNPTGGQNFAGGGTGGAGTGGFNDFTGGFGDPSTGGYAGGMPAYNFTADV